LLEGVEKRQLCDNVPVGKPLTVKPQLQALDPLRLPGKQTPIVVYIV
jgi:hypothetical protein